MSHSVLLPQSEGEGERKNNVSVTILVGKKKKKTHQNWWKFNLQLPNLYLTFTFKYQAYASDWLYLKYIQSSNCKGVLEIWCSFFHLFSPGRHTRMRVKWMLKTKVLYPFHYSTSVHILLPIQQFHESNNWQWKCSILTLCKYLSNK